MRWRGPNLDCSATKKYKLTLRNISEDLQTLSTFVRKTVNKAEVWRFYLHTIKKKIADQLFTFRFHCVVNKMSTECQLTCTTFFLVRVFIQVRCWVVLLSGFKWVSLKVSSCFRIHLCDSCSKFYAPVSIQRFLLCTWIKSSQQVFLFLAPPVCGLLTYWEDSCYYFFIEILPVSSHSFSQSESTAYQRYMIN
jgi:hypothetical protein